MRLLEWRKRPSSRIEQIIVPEEAVGEGSSEWISMLYVQMFVNHALGTAMYLRDELPREALICASLADYVCEVNNGGHAQFVGNTGWDEDMRADIQEGLATLRLDAVARIFADLEAFAADQPDRFKHNDGQANDPSFLEPGRRYQIDSYFEELDDRFYGAPAKSLGAALGTWIRSRPSWMRVIPDAEYNRVPQGWKVPDHPLRDERWAAMWHQHGPRWRGFFTKLRDYLNHARPPK